MMKFSNIIINPFYCLTLFIMFLLALGYSNVDITYNLIVHINDSPINGGRTHYFLYSLFTLLFAYTYLCVNNENRAIKYLNKTKYYLYEKITVAYKWCIIMSFTIIVVMNFLLLINHLIILDSRMLIHEFAGFVSFIVYYGMLINLFLLLNNLRINKSLSLIIIFLLSFSNYFTYNLYSSSVALLLSNFDVNVQINWIIITFYLCLNIILIQLNIYLFGRRDLL